LSLKHELHLFASIPGSPILSPNFFRVYLVPVTGTAPSVSPLYIETIFVDIVVQYS